MILQKKICRFPTDEQRQFCYEYLKNNNLGNRGYFDGDDKQQYYGLLAQIMVTDLFNLPRPQSEGFDGGYDFKLFGLKFDVKCELRNVPFDESRFVHNFSEPQKDYAVD